MKKKKRSCPLCKPHKMGGDNRWKPKQYVRMKADIQEMRAADRRELMYHPDYETLPTHIG
jgi:hypothetical protein